MLVAQQENQRVRPGGNARIRVIEHGALDAEHPQRGRGQVQLELKTPWTDGWPAPPTW